MKNPSPLLLLALAAALPAFAAPPDHRCDLSWLAKAQAVAERGGRPADEGKYLKDEKMADGTMPVFDLESSPKVCDATVWRYLVDPATKTWRDAGVQGAWGLGLSQQIKILLTVDDLYQSVDAQGREALAAGDAVADAAVKLGVAVKRELPGPDKLPAGFTHPSFSGEKAYSVQAATAAGGAVGAELKAALGQLLADKPAPKPKPGEKAAPGEVVLGPGVLAFRKAVISLADELAVSAARRDLAGKRGVDGRMKGDFAQGSASYAASAKVVGKDGKASISDAVAAKDVSYHAALKYLTNPEIKDGADAGDHPEAVLSRLDAGLRNLIATRAAAVDAAVAAAKQRLNGQSVKETLAAVEHGAQGGNEVKAPANGTLAADVMAKLAATKEYSQLNALFDNKKGDAKWLESAEGKEVSAQLQTMRADAAATKVVKGGIQYSIAGQKLTDTGIRVADLKTDKEYRDFIAGVVAANITSDGKLQAFLAALGGAGEPGKPVAPPLTPAEQPAGAKLPPTVAQPAPTAVQSAWAALKKSTPAPGLWDSIFSSKSTMERYRDAEREKAAAAAEAETRKRAAAQVTFDRQKAQLARQKAIEAAKINDDARDPALEKGAAEKWRTAKLAQLDASYAQKTEAARKATLDAAGLTPPAQITATLKQQQDAADAQINAAYVDGIAESIKDLREEYKKPRNSRRYAAASESTLGRFYDNHLDLVDGYFVSTWDTAPAKDASYGACRGKLWGTVNGAGVFLDPSPDNVDANCVHAGLVSYLKSQLGKGVPSDK